MPEQCALFIDVEKDWKTLQALFDEYDDDDDVDDVEKPTCKAGELMDFGWYDHDRVDYIIIDKPLTVSDFFSNKDVTRMSTWEIKDIECIKSACLKLGVKKLNFVFHLNEIGLSDDSIGKSKKTENGYIQFIGHFDKNGKLNVG